MLINTIENIITIEWNMFQKVINIGGRADCQDDYETFYIMRRSQYENWSDRMIRCYYSFLCDCEANGRNLVTEKYARMMQYTDLHYFNKHLAAHMPPVPQVNYRLINQIIPVLLQWEEEFAVAYPGLAGRGRPITSEGDASGFTSMETYARGEFETYPTELLQLYADYVENLKSAGKSMSLMIQDTMVKLYGYSSIEEAEASCRT
ncbi:DUF4125 family protein [Ihubacter sp. rT4E-8]|uniref:DUF4125 family protein n=1 Tax=Ihubacter sp. rT4E-8 TaxID=3242369 RepID=UPI003CF453A9